MMIVHVHIHIKPEYVTQFKEASIENARNSLHESGVTRFDLLQQQDDPNRFLLIEIYKSIEDAASHKETAHYKKWRDTVAEMMAEPRKSEKYLLLYPMGA
jgi:(4S)-4-hydroxy-5-phosphonooxypentane-2,3-dione isomerase